MSDSDLSISSISSQKLASTTQQAEVAVFKKALEQEGQVQKQLIEGAKTLPEGVGGRLNTVA